MGFVHSQATNIAIPNPIGLRGIEFIEITVADEQQIVPVLRAFGFTREAVRPDAPVTLWRQNDIRILVTTSPTGFAAEFRRVHGPGICGMGWRVDNPARALVEAARRGAQPWVDASPDSSIDAPALVGIGGSLIYLVRRDGDQCDAWQAFERTTDHAVPDLGFRTIDHLTNNVYKGTLQHWANFYRYVFGFTEVRHFDIRGEKTGLYSFALRSPDGSFCIPINEGTESASQIEEYLREYNGPGIQHVAFLANDLVDALMKMKGSSISFLDIDDEYYQTVFERVPGVTEDHTQLRELKILVDGDDDGYLLQIFTKNLLGPIFIELIQRRNHLSFGENNFGALFRSIERDQQKRGVI
jgi:4-hydroxyphenylpyruvate dioxygenase